jgi:RimJ/RimL family protein N-acetyltransferase
MRLTVPDLGDHVVSLRLPAECDVDAITAACQDPEIPRFTRIMSPYEREHAVGFVSRAGQHWHNGTEATFVIASRERDHVMGAIGIMHLADERHAEIGYWVAADARRHGVATRAVRLVTRWGLCELGLPRIELMTRLENVASQGVAQKAGYTREGVLRSYADLGKGGFEDVVMFSLLPRDLAS